MDLQTLASQFNRTVAELRDTPDADRIEFADRIDFWVQTWADTSCGHGCGGQAYTPSLVMAVVYLPTSTAHPRLRVYSGGRLLHDVPYGPEQRQALEDRHVPGKGSRWRPLRGL